MFLQSPADHHLAPHQKKFPSLEPGLVLPAAMPWLMEVLLSRQIAPEWQQMHAHEWNIST